jgi:hypothetical protein
MANREADFAPDRYPVSFLLNTEVGAIDINQVSGCVDSGGKE